MSLLYCTQVTKEINNMTLKMPYQCFINGNFEDAENGKVYDTINPTDGSVSHMDIRSYESTPTEHVLILKLCVTIMSFSR